jgi:hypothetical protein
MTREHRFVEAEDVVVMPRPPSKGEIERERWSRFTVHEYRDPVVIGVGHQLHSAYVERFWLPLVGPASICMARNLLARPSGSAVEIDLLGGELGLRGSVALHTLARLERFNIVLRTERSVLIRTHLAPLTLGQFAKLPEHIRVAHSSFVIEGDE